MYTSAIRYIFILQFVTIFYQNILICKERKIYPICSYVTFLKMQESSWPPQLMLSTGCDLAKHLIMLLDVTIYAINLHLCENVICKLNFQCVLFLISNFYLNQLDFCNKKCHVICKQVFDLPNFLICISSIVVGPVHSIQQRGQKPERKLKLLGVQNHHNAPIVTIKKTTKLITHIRMCIFS